MTLRLFMDEDSLHAAGLEALRRAGFDCLTATEAGREGLPDEQQLEFASAAGRIVFTRNTRDFVRLHDEWTAGGRLHAGIITLTSQRTSVGEILHALSNASTSFSSEEMGGRLVFLRNHL